ncbi:acetyltransferase [Acanthamoeba castellanii str. Neff]|uniref:Acetyltransferase n=1 Tax=Acanthamoeba castellanii (strain ATCC 30010 / Neff) TaxID=1257118 RepID=L8GPH5_ACACF|nr:acetyltransferase [Acanthamoeba castellanii str. Neff]ELR14026.1 acetyltransferase [Acanthamoeba castellanii str. Neff]
MEVPGGTNFTHRADLGYWLAESHWGRGIMTDAVAAFVRYLFSDDFATRCNGGQPIIRLEARVYAHNAGSGRVLEKAGFQLECRERLAYIKQGQYLDGFKMRTPAETQQ